MKILIKLFLLPLSLFAFTNQELKVVFSSYTPPYVFQKTNNGIVIDIVKEILHKRGYKVKPVFLPIGRGFKMFEEKKVDATSIIKKSSGLIKAYYSEYFMQYHNKAFSLKNRDIKLEKMADLNSLHVIGFQNAHKVLSKEYIQSIESSTKYRELANQKSQVLMLFKGRVDVIVLDESIFEYYKNMLIKEKKISKETEVKSHHFFEPTKYRTAFVDKKARDDFNEGLQELKNSGRYDAIYEQYIKLNFEIKK